MSDDDEFMMDDAADEEQEFDFEYEDDDDDADAMNETLDPTIHVGDGARTTQDLENMYYNAKSTKESDLGRAIELFEKLVDAEKECGQKGDWGFKALKQLTKVNFILGRLEPALEAYTELLTYTKGAVTRNYSEKSINNILDFVSGEGTKFVKAKAAVMAKDPTATLVEPDQKRNDQDMTSLQAFYDTTKIALEEAKNARLSMKTNLKLAKLWLDRKEYTRLLRITKELHGALLESAMASGAEDPDQSHGTILLEVYALEIQMYNDTKNTKKLKELYQQTLSVKSAIPHPRIMGVIRECGGKMHMGEKEWEKAQTDFYESFRNYDEAGSYQRIAVLKYLVLANMLSGSTIDPFDSQETKPYKNDPEVAAMTSLVQAYQRREIAEAEKILNGDAKATIMGDPFIRSYIDEVLRNIRTQVLLTLIKPYTKVALSFIAKQLNIPEDAVQDLLIALILDKKVKGRIDGMNHVLLIDPSAKSDDSLYAAMSAWTSHVAQLGEIVSSRLGSNDRTSILV